MSDLDERLAQIRARKASALAAGTDDLARLKAELEEARSAVKHDMDRAISGVKTRLHEAEGKLSSLDQAHHGLAAAVSDETRRIASLRRGIIAAVSILVFIAMMIVGISWKIGRDLIEDARNETEQIRAENAEAVAFARAEGGAAISALEIQLAE